jgi:hypothetical protein
MVGGDLSAAAGTGERGLSGQAVPYIAGLPVSLKVLIKLPRATDAQCFRLKVRLRG